MINEVLKRLSKGKHGVIIGHRGQSYDEIKQRIEDGYIHVKFTQTKGGTELGINVDLDKTNVGDVDFDKGKGILHIKGTTNLNHNEVRCTSDIDLKTRIGKGYLEIIEEEIVASE